MVESPQDPWQPLPGGALWLGAAAPARLAEWQSGCGRGQKKQV